MSEHESSADAADAAETMALWGLLWEAAAADGLCAWTLDRMLDRAIATTSADETPLAQPARQIDGSGRDVRL